MVGGEGTELDRQIGTAERRQLVCVEVNGPAEVVGVGEQSARLLEIENPLLAEHVHRFGKAPSGDLRVDFFDQATDPDFGVWAVFERNLVGREAGRMKIDGMKPVGIPYHLEHPHLGLEVETVAGFSFDGRRAVNQEAVEAASSCRGLVARVARTVALMPPPERAMSI